MKFLTTLLNLFRRNWGLKLLSLALAIVIYQSLKTTDNSSRHKQTNDRTLFPAR